MLPSGRRLFYLWAWFSCRHGWLGPRIRWRMIWAHLIFWPVTRLMPHWGISPFRLGFIDPPLICMTTLRYKIHVGQMVWFHFILILRGASLESFNQIHIFWYSRDSWMELSQARGFPHHHFSKVHVRSFVRLHGVMLDLSGLTSHVWCYTGAYFPSPTMETIVLSRICYSFHLTDLLYWSLFLWFLSRWAFSVAQCSGFDRPTSHDSLVDCYVEMVVCLLADYSLETLSDYPFQMTMDSSSRVFRVRGV